MKLQLVSAALALTACTPGGSDGGSKAELQANCEALISAETETRPEDVKAIATEPDSSGTTITVSVVGSEVPWICRADPAGVIEGIGFKSDS